MGQCLTGDKSNKQEISRYLVNDSHFVAASDKEKNPKKRAEIPTTSEAYLDSMWISRGMPTCRPDFSDLDRRIVKESFVFLEANMVNIGRILFMKFFEAMPAVRQLFLKQHGEESAAEPFTIKKHAERVMLAIGRAIKLLDEPKMLEAFLHELGGRHGQYNVRIEYFDCFIPFFIQAIHPVLKEKWASSIEDAWAAFFRRTIHLMKEAVVF